MVPDVCARVYWRAHNRSVRTAATLPITSSEFSTQIRRDPSGRAAQRRYAHRDDRHADEHQHDRTRKLTEHQCESAGPLLRNQAARCEPFQPSQRCRGGKTFRARAGPADSLIDGEIPEGSVGLRHRTSPTGCCPGYGGRFPIVVFGKITLVLPDELPAFNQRSIQHTFWRELSFIGLRQHHDGCSAPGSGQLTDLEAG